MSMGKHLLKDGLSGPLKTNRDAGLKVDLEEI